MKMIYVATRFDNWREAEKTARALETKGHTCTSSWIKVARELDGECDRVAVGTDRRRREAIQDLEDVAAADAILLLVPHAGGTGMWVEMGFALGHRWRVEDINPSASRTLRIICVGPARERTLFCELTENYPTVPKALEAL